MEACGGVWFDNFELKKFDEVHESAGEKLVESMALYANESIDLNERIYTPRYPDILMVRRFYSPKRQIEIDEYPQCGGIWLDAGELARMRDLFPAEEQQKKGR
ncbi:MAG: zf-TFIIB domain-containing protein [Synechococcus sp.]